MQVQTSAAELAQVDVVSAVGARRDGLRRNGRRGGKPAPRVRAMPESGQCSRVSKIQYGSGRRDIGGCLGAGGDGDLTSWVCADLSCVTSKVFLCRPRIRALLVLDI